MPRYTASPDEIDRLQTMWGLLIEAGRFGAELTVTLADGTTVRGLYAGEVRVNSRPDEPVQWAGHVTLVAEKGERRTVDYLDIVGVSAG